MNTFKSSFFVIVFALQALIPLVMCALTTPQEYLNAHNVARGQVKVSNIVWDNAVATYAQNYANSRISDCSLKHSYGPYGENLAKGNGSFTGISAVNLWVAEKPYYDYTSNSCTGGKQCLHYTQVVWRDSVRLGCGMAQCTAPNTGYWFVTCSYDPPGNYVGEYPY